MDLNGDGADRLCRRHDLLEEHEPEGWPVQPGQGRRARRADATRASSTSTPTARWTPSACVDGPRRTNRDDRRVAWRRNLGGDPPRFGPPETLGDVGRRSGASYWPPFDDGPRRGLLVQHDVYQAVSFYEQTRATAASPVSSGSDAPSRTRRSSGAERSGLAVPLRLGRRRRPRSAGRRRLRLAADRDQRRHATSGRPWPRPGRSCPKASRSGCCATKFSAAKHWHNMGYPYPAYVDWDADGLPRPDAAQRDEPHLLVQEHRHARQSPSSARAGK